MLYNDPTPKNIRNGSVNGGFMLVSLVVGNSGSTDSPVNTTN